MSYSGYSTTGRTASQSSIYDYPEHLNPFYEDENHKRLRFWHFGGHRSDKPKSERRGSLVSIRDGLRDMWEFKTFRVKKKRSSSLGISKTSESPPPLRRDEHDMYYNTISDASPYRNTINTPGYTQSNTTTPMFPRNSRYRSSLQQQPRENGIGLHRNDRYRSTIQNGFATYSGGNAVTSTPRARYNTGTTGRGMTPGVSQSSLKSSNPFEDDDFDDSLSMNESFISANGTIRQSMSRPRKKRRAPPPPIPRSANASVESTSAASLSTRLKIEESPPPENSEEIEKLTNLTAEIESFVRTTSDDDFNRMTVEQNKPSNLSETSSDTNNNHIMELVIVESQGEVKTVVEQPIEVHDGQLRPEEPKTEAIENTSQVHTQSVSVVRSEIPESVEQLSRVQELSIVEEEPKDVVPPLPSPRARPAPPPVPQPLQVSEEVPKPLQVSEEVDLENMALPETPIPARRLNKNRNQNKANGGVLRITESVDSVTTTTAEEEENMESKAVKHVNYEFEYKVKPMQSEVLDEKIGTARLKISESTGDINSLTNAGTERRRSVRDIIESINKSQSLLKVNHDSMGTLYSAQSNDSVNRNMKELNEREKEIQRLLREMDTQFSEQSQASKPVPPTKKRGSYYDNVPEADENMDNLDDRYNLLSKSDFRSKKSPTKSLGMEQNDETQFQDCIDWNPLPKPRRSRHFPEPAHQSTSASVAGSVLTAIDQNNNDNNQS